MTSITGTRIIESNIIPAPGYLAINIFGFIFTRDLVKFMSKRSYLTHEKIHTAQYKELWYVGFLPVYIWYYLRCLFKYKNHRMAYRLNPLEQEAYAQESRVWYLDQRGKFAWKNYKWDYTE